MSNICREAEAAWFSSQYFFDIRRFGNAGLGALDPSTSVNRVLCYYCLHIYFQSTIVGDSMLIHC